MRRAFHAWLAIALGIALIAQAAFTGQPTSEVAGTMTLAMLAIGLPSSILAYPLALAAVSPFEAQGLFPHNSRLVMMAWWAVFLAVGMAQWGIGLWLWDGRRSRSSVRPRGARSSS